MLKRLSWGRLAGCLAAALLTLIGLAWHFEAASRLTPEARELLAKYDRLIAGIQEQVNERFLGIFFEKR